MQVFAWYQRGGIRRNKMVLDTESVNSHWGLIGRYRDQNRLRRALSVLHNCKFGSDGYYPAPCYGDISDLVISFDAQRKEYSLFVYILNWPGKHMFLAGILVGRNWDRKLKHLVH
jgi:hypothetical protein